MPLSNKEQLELAQAMLADGFDMGSSSLEGHVANVGMMIEKGQMQMNGIGINPNTNVGVVVKNKIEEKNKKTNSNTIYAESPTSKTSSEFKKRVDFNENIGRGSDIQKSTNYDYNYEKGVLNEAQVILDEYLINKHPESGRYIQKILETPIHKRQSIFEEYIKSGESYELTPDEQKKILSERGIDYNRYVDALYNVNEIINQELPGVVEISGTKEGVGQNINYGIRTSTIGRSNLKEMPADERERVLREYKSKK